MSSRKLIRTGLRKQLPSEEEPIERELLFFQIYGTNQSALQHYSIQEQGRKMEAAIPQNESPEVEHSKPSNQERSKMRRPKKREVDKRKIPRKAHENLVPLKRARTDK